MQTGEDKDSCRHHGAGDGEWAGGVYNRQIYLRAFTRLVTGWTVWGSNPGGCEIFHTRPDQPWGPRSLLHNGYRVIPGGKTARSVALTTHPSNHRHVKERVELYLNSVAVPSWPVLK